MKIQAAILAMPVSLALAAASAGAAPVTLVPLGTTHHDQIAALGSTCAVPYAAAKMTTSYVTYPTIAAEMGAEGIAKVGISLSDDGTVTRAWSIRSTGNRMLDLAAIESAKENRYEPERSQCRAVAGDYELDINFTLGD